MSTIDKQRVVPVTDDLPGVDGTTTTASSPTPPSTTSKPAAFDQISTNQSDAKKPHSLTRVYSSDENRHTKLNSLASIESL